MAKSKTRTKVKLVSSESPHYYTTSRKNTNEKLELMKYDPIVRKHVKFKEAKIKS